MNKVTTTRIFKGNYKLNITTSNGETHELRLEDLKNYGSGLKGWEVQSWDFDLGEASNFTTKAQAIAWLTNCFDPSQM